MGADDRIAGRGTAVAHPTRRTIISALAGESELSPTAFARLEGVERLRAFYYHFDYLIRHGLIELVRTEEHRGTVERFYALTALGRAAARRLTNTAG